MTQAQIDAAAQAMHAFEAPRVGNASEEWEHISPQARNRWLRLAKIALSAAEREAETPVVEEMR